MPDWKTMLIPVLLRWIHVIAGIAWIGHLWYFNLVQAHAEKALDAGQKKIVVPHNRGRAFFWFRWGSMVTMLSGLLYLVWEQFVATNLNFAHWFDKIATNNVWITMGALFGLMMWYNVWFVIWPRQKQIIAGIATGNKPADFDALVARAGRASRVNTYLSVPMLFGMSARSHFSAGDMTETLIWCGGFVALGLFVAHLFLTKIGPKAGTEFAAMLPPPAPPAK